MQKLRERKIYQITVIVYAVLMFIKHLPHLALSYDDLIFLTLSDIYPDPIKFALNRYTTWSARILIDVLDTFVLTHIPGILWAVLDTLMFILLYVDLVKITHGKRNDVMGIVLPALLILLIPFKVFNTAGWRTTTVNYLWTMSTGFYVLSCCETFLKGEKLKTKDYVFLVLCSLFACGQEQMWLLMGGYMFVVLLVLLKRKQKPDIGLWLVLGIMMAKLIQIVLCPGNAIRLKTESKMYFPAFIKYSAVNKFLAGWLSMCSTVLLVIHKFPMLCAVPFILCVLPQKAIRNRVKACMPGMVLTGGTIWMCSSNRALTVIKMFTKNLAEMDVFPMNAGTVVYFLVSVLFVLSAMYCFYISFEKKESGWLALTVLAAVLVRVVLGFSASLFVSGARIWLFTTILFYILICFCFQRVFYPNYGSCM